MTLPALIVPMAQSDAARQVVGARYDIYQAPPDDLADRKVLFWASAPLYLPDALECSYLGGELTPASAAKLGYDWAAMVAYARDNKHPVLPAENVAVQVSGPDETEGLSQPTDGSVSANFQSAPATPLSEAAQDPGGASTGSDLHSAPNLATVSDPELATTSPDPAPEYPEHYFSGDEPEQAVPASVEPINGADPVAEREAEAMRHGGHYPRVSVEISTEGWTTPSDMWGGVNLPEVRAEWLPPQLADYALDLADQIGCDPVQTALNTIMACAIAVTEHIKLQVLPDSTRWSERARLFGAVVGEPSTKKGPALRAAIAPVIVADLKFRRAWESAHDEYVHLQKTYDLQLQDYYREAKKNAVAPRPEAPTPPACARLWTDDHTKESLAPLLVHNPRGRIAIVKEELSSLVGGMGAYSATGSKEKDRGDYLAAFDGQSRYIDRVGEGKSVYIEHWSLLVLGGIQPSVLTRLAAGNNGNVGMLEDGMLARFMLVVSGPLCRPTRNAPDHSAENRYQHLIERLIALQPAPEPVLLTPEAQEFREECAEWIFATMQIKLPPALLAAVGKYEGMHMRLTLLAHAIDCADRGEDIIRTHIPIECCVQAWTWIQKVVFPHALHFYTSILGHTARHDALRTLCEWFLSHDTITFTRSNISNGWMGYRSLDTRQQNDLFTTAELIGWIRKLDARRWEVNPLAHELFYDQALSAKRDRAAKAKLWAARRATTREAGADG